MIFLLAQFTGSIGFDLLCVAVVVAIMIVIIHRLPSFCYTDGAVSS